jgi:pimeloyl-ACP methyl ester carboxylesterase
MTLDSLPSSGLPQGIHSRFVEGVNGLRMHVLEAGEPGRPMLLLLHGFPELAYSWRKVMTPLAGLGYYVVAPDQRGYGRTTGWDADFDGDLFSFRKLNLVRDALALVNALGYREVEAVIGHDFGSTVAGWAAVVRPDVFRRAVMMSASFSGAPSLPGPLPLAPSPLAERGDREIAPTAAYDIHAAMRELPRPRKHYQMYYSTRPANEDMWRAPQGLHDFLRAYYHHKSADWAGNKPFRLNAWTAEDVAQMPTYYIMDLNRTMPETVAEEMPSAAEIAACRWLTEAELAVYAAEYERNGFQGGLNWYRCGTSGIDAAELVLYSGRTLDVPSCFIAGASDWGTYQRPGSMEAMRDRACTDFRGVHLVEGAGHWVQQEQPEETVRLLTAFLEDSL